MEKKYEEDELDKLIEEQFINEAKIMEEALFSNNDTEDYDASEEEILASYQKLISRLKADGVYRRETDAAEKSSESTGTVPSGAVVSAGAVSNGSSTDDNKVVSMPKKRSIFNSYRFVKTAGFVLVSAACVFAASMTSEANRDYVVKHAELLAGKDTRMVVDNDESNESANVDEYEAIANIEAKLGIDMPEFFYRPANFEFHKYEVNEYVRFGKIEYLYNDTVIELGADKDDETTVSNLYSLHGEEVDTVDIDGEDIQIVIRKIQDEGDRLPSYLAQWEREGVVYHITGKIELEKLIKMLETMRFYS